MPVFPSPPYVLVLLSFLCLSSIIAAPSRTEAARIAIIATGDIMLAGKGETVYSQLGYDYPFAGVAHELRRADIAIGNLEAPLTRGGTEFTAKKFRFRANPMAAAALRRAGITVLTLANNHIMDYGVAGLADTLLHLEKNNIDHAGAGDNLAAARRPAMIKSQGRTIAILAYSLTYPSKFYAGDNSAGTAPGIAAYFEKDIAKAKRLADHVVVAFHWGAEKSPVPKPYQILAARRAVDAGAEIVIGHHPHVLQGIEWYGNGIIFYSLGNFAFGSMSTSSDVGALARITLEDGIREVEIIPLNVLNSEIHFQPKILKGEQGLAAIRRINRISRQFGTEIRQDGRRYLVHK